MTDVLMPRLSDSMEEGTILTWLIEDGGQVQAGAELAEIETDKATMTYEAESDGVLSVVAPAGSTISVGEVIARVGDGQADRHAEADAGNGRTERGPAAAGHHAQPTVSSDAPLASDADAGADSEDTDVAATPMARRIAAAHGVALGSLTGSGPRGRVVRADVMRAAGIDDGAGNGSATSAAREAPRPSPAAATSSPRPSPADGAPAPTGPGGTGDDRVELTRLQATIARRMAEAKATVPHFQVQTEVEMSATLAFREELRTVAQSRELPVPSLNDIIVKACALGLRRFPRANGSYADGGFVLHGRVNVGVAVAGEDALVVPVIHDADTLTLGQITQRTRELAAAVRDGSVTPPQLSGATFTVSNLGMYGMTAITPVVNPPQAAILGVGAIRDELARDDHGEIVDRRPLTLTLSCDHRILYGADAARFLAAIRDLLQAPAGLAL